MTFINKLALFLAASLLAAFAAAQTPALTTLPQSQVLQTPVIMGPPLQLPASQGDPCAATTSSATPTPVLSAAQLQAQQFQAALIETNPGSGTGPIPDVFDWQPRALAPAGTIIVLRGQGFQPAVFSARVGSDMLQVAGTATEIRLTIPPSARSSGEPLVVWHRNGGRARTLEPNYRVFDPVVRITRVAPEAFGRGQTVTLCGTSLFNTWQAAPVSNFPETRMLKIGSQYVEMHEVAVSANGDRLTFRAGSTALNRVVVSQTFNPATGYASLYGFVAASPQPDAVSGLVALTARSAQLDSSQANNTNILAPAASLWRRSLPLQVGQVYGSGRFGSLKPPFLLMEATGDYGPLSRQMVIEGLGLDGASFRIGTSALNASTPGSAALGTTAFAAVTVGTPSGQVCGTKDGVTRCLNPVFRVSQAPFFDSVPNSPFAMNTVHTLIGLHLLPDPGISGLSYEFRLSGLGVCGTLNIIEHSDSQIRFRIDSPNPRPSVCTSNLTLFGGTPTTHNVMQFLVRYANVEVEYLRKPYDLVLPPN